MLSVGSGRVESLLLWRFQTRILPQLKQPRRRLQTCWANPPAKARLVRMFVSLELSSKSQTNKACATLIYLFGRVASWQFAVQGGCQGRCAAKRLQPGRSTFQHMLQAGSTPKLVAFTCLVSAAHSETGFRCVVLTLRVL